MRAAIIALLLCFVPLSAWGQRDNYVVLRVNDRIATLLDFQERVADWIRAVRRQQNITATDRQTQIEEAPRRVAKEMFEELLMLSRADQLGISVGEIELEEHLERLKERVGVRTEEEFRQALAGQGLTVEEFRDSQLRTLTVQRVTSREVYARIQVEDDELRRIYREREEEFTLPERRRVQEILVPESDSTSETLLRERAAEVRSEMADGRDPKAVAEGKGEAVRFIDVGWVTQGDLSSDLEAAAWALAEGEVSEPVAARGGFHVLKIAAIEAASAKPFEEVVDQLRAEEQGRRLDDEIGAYLTELEEKSFFVANLPERAQGFKTMSGRVVENGASRDLQLTTATEPR
ncbi:MAG: peptidyl-prolyl cis-trans isomerase [Acidobacteriota bacterium]